MFVCSHFFGQEKNEVILSLEWPWLGKFKLFFDIQKAPELKKTLILLTFDSYWILPR